MSLARAVTKRIKRSEDSPSLPTRSQSVKMSPNLIDRAKISSPVALISTTNMLSYNAPDIASLRNASPSSPLSQTSEDSDHSASASTVRSRSSSHGSHVTLTDASSVGSSPTSPVLKPNHLSGYFTTTSSNTKTPRRSASSSQLQQQPRRTPSSEHIPAIPERALSHSKRAHERLAQKRSLQHLPRSSTHSSRSSREQRSSTDIFSTYSTTTSTIQEEPTQPHPFGKELEQLNEVAEEFGGAVRDVEFEADLKVIRERGLGVFCAQEYLLEIKPLFGKRFGVQKAMAWI
ncbi:hypothetical protein M011DRAFT_177569 [Sporormia fimetaria CBS 119925]|uniref:Uncharacterized protein n=1 Tax=Sporormia fimetaria CBS 119925 TaxID=1340428 RepID=A0A6A6VLN3_9PLEO|nr:hypothetical protein M011DRAFT_177569 [Sporormia fimetaria CBS 119925]